MNITPAQRDDEPRTSTQQLTKLNHGQFRKVSTDRYLLSDLISHSFKTISPNGFNHEWAVSYSSVWVKSQLSLVLLGFTVPSDEFSLVWADTLIRAGLVEVWVSSQTILSFTCHPIILEGALKVYPSVVQKYLYMPN